MTAPIVEMSDRARDKNWQTVLTGIVSFGPIFEPNARHASADNHSGNNHLARFWRPTADVVRRLL